MEHTNRQLRVTVDQSACVGNASCVAIAPNAFALDENRQSTVVGEPGPDDADLVIEAAENCPVRAISVADADSGESIFPEP
jgi:ferredoxin